MQKSFASQKEFSLWLQGTLSHHSSDLLILSFLPDTSLWSQAIKDTLSTISLVQTPDALSPISCHLLSLVSEIEYTGQCALAADGLFLSGSVLCPSGQGFYLTSFKNHQCRTDHIYFEDLAFPASPSCREMKILTLGLMLYSTYDTSLLEAIDAARHELHN